MPRALHLQEPKTQRTIKSTDGSISFYLDEQCQLLIKPKSIDYPFPLDVQTVHALANLLIDQYQSIVAEASKYNGEKHRGNPAESWSNWT